MSYKKITTEDKEKFKFDKDGNAIIKLPPGTDRILFQHWEKDVNVKDTQFKILLSEIRSVKDELKSDIRNLEVSLTAKIDANTALIKSVDAKLDEHIRVGH